MMSCDRSASSRVATPSCRSARDTLPLLVLHLEQTAGPAAAADSSARFLS